MWNMFFGDKFKEKIVHMVYESYGLPNISNTSKLQHEFLGANNIYESYEAHIIHDGNKSCLIHLKPNFEIDPDTFFVNYESAICSSESNYIYYGNGNKIETKHYTGIINAIQKLFPDSKITYGYYKHTDINEVINNDKECLRIYDYIHKPEFYMKGEYAHDLIQDEHGDYIDEGDYKYKIIICFKNTNENGKYTHYLADKVDKKFSLKTGEILIQKENIDHVFKYEKPTNEDGEFIIAKKHITIEPYVEDR